MNTYNLEIIIKDINTYNLQIIIKDMVIGIHIFYNYF
jgi:hypothetical protein